MEKHAKCEAVVRPTFHPLVISTGGTPSPSTQDWLASSRLCHLTWTSSTGEVALRTMCPLVSEKGGES
jgi:hypothetical protein